MKHFKKILCVLFIIPLISVTSLNASSINNQYDDYGRASDCVNMARGAILTLAEASGEDPNGDNFEAYLGIYMTMYENCLNN
jgi:hypothetical protein